MRQLVLEAFSSISPEYCQKVCDHVKHLEEVTIQAEMAMDSIVEQMIIKVGDSSDVELEETPLFMANTKSNEDQIIQKLYGSTINYIHEENPSSTLDVLVKVTAIVRNAVVWLTTKNVMTAFVLRTDALTEIHNYRVQVQI